MPPVNPTFGLESADTEHGPRLVLAMALMACLFWTGCSGISRSSAVSSQPENVPIQTTLPNASIGSRYLEVLSVNGGRPPNNFVVSEGEMPPGLVLNSGSGSISGIPTRAGTFTFAVTITSAPGLVEAGREHSSVSGHRTYRLAVVASVPVTVQISPANPSIAAGGKLQFAAAVSNTNNTAVTWSASAGTISSTGLFTAPASGSPKSITITASSLAEGGAEASTAATITSASRVTVQISPANPSIAAGGKLQFAAAVSNTHNTAVTWSASAGTISSTGLFTAPASGSPKSITITASSLAEGGAEASTAATITSANRVTVQISPANPSIAAGGKLQFAAAVSNTNNTAVTWSASAGTISSTGLFTAPASGSPKSITITASSLAESTAQASTAIAITSLNLVTVQLSPRDPSIAAGGKLQFSATVSNTSNSAVTWSASAGTISANGLFTAPANSNVNSITVTAWSVADPAVRDSATATVTSNTFAIATTSVPPALQATAYSASLTADGGQPPYHWRIVSGVLPPGLQLNTSTGLLSGSATKAGTFPFSVQGTDAASHTAQRSYSLLVSTSGRICGPPAYDCSRTDLNIARTPTHVPNVGNLTGANTIVTDPDFGNRIVRITDWNTDPGAPAENRSYISAASGSADENLWNVDSTMFILQTLGDAGYPYTFDPSTLQAARMYVSSYPSHGGLKLPGGVWSRVDPNMLYTAENPSTSINKYDFSDRTNPPSPQLVYDFTSSPNCLPHGFTTTWQSKGGVSAGDAVFGMAYSNAGDQGTAVYAVAYKAGSGCTVLNTGTGQVWGDWGAKGTINIADRWTIHNVKISKDGNWLILTSQGCLVSSCSNGPYFWQIGTTNLSSCGDGKTGGQRCGGHWTAGYSHWVNNYDAGKFVIRPLSEPTAFRELTNAPPGVGDPLDQHASWNNVDPADSLPFFLTFWSLSSPFPGPWYNEITGVAPDGSGKVWRFAHNFITGRSQIFSTQYGIGSVSQDGRFFILSSDWMGTLGSQSAASTCTIGKDCRGDVFVVELN